MTALREITSGLVIGVAIAAAVFGAAYLIGGNQ
jgi:hypothetical protein